MPKRLIPILTDDEVQQLTDLLNRSQKPYLRERASAILKLSNGQPVSQIATQGLRKRHHETISDWFYRFQADGVKGLLIKPGRGRKPAFSPSAK